MKLKYYIPLPLLFGYLLLLTSCSGNKEGFERVIVSGVVSYQGEPVPYGRIRFTPRDGTTGPVSVTTIKEGQYRIDHKGGVPVGTHTVQMWSFDPMELEIPTPGGPPVRQYLPQKYNLKSELVATVENGTGEDVQNFDLK